MEGGGGGGEANLHVVGGLLVGGGEQVCPALNPALSWRRPQNMPCSYCHKLVVLAV